MPTREEIADHHAGAILDHIEWARTMKGAISRAEIARFVYDAIGEASAELVRQEREEKLRVWPSSSRKTAGGWQSAAPGRRQNSG